MCFSLNSSVHDVEVCVLDFTPQSPSNENVTLLFVFTFCAVCCFEQVDDGVPLFTCTTVLSVVRRSNKVNNGGSIVYMNNFVACC